MEFRGLGWGGGTPLWKRGARTQCHPKSLPGLDVSNHRQLTGGGKKRPPAGHLREQTVRAIVPEADLAWQWPHIDALLFRIGSRCLFICKPLCLLLKILLQSRHTTDCDSLWDSPVYKHWSLLLTPRTLWDHQGLNTGSTDHSCNPQMNPPHPQETCRLGRASQFVCLTVGYFMGLFSCNRENSTDWVNLFLSLTHTYTQRDVLSQWINMSGMVSGTAGSRCSRHHQNPAFLQVLFSSGLASLSSRLSPHNVKMAAMSLKLTDSAPSWTKRKLLFFTNF